MNYWFVEKRSEYLLISCSRIFTTQKLRVTTSEIEQLLKLTRELLVNYWFVEKRSEYLLISCCRIFTTQKLRVTTSEIEQLRQGKNGEGVKWDLKVAFCNWDLLRNCGLLIETGNTIRKTPSLKMLSSDFQTWKICAARRRNFCEGASSR